ncbi:MAG: VOC family protein [Acidobacteria bacterium]|nr:VOC family protein [Acidobacteriota bacterium]
MTQAPLDHVAVFSRDLNTDIIFYQQLGYELETLYHDWAMLRDGEGRGIALLSPTGKHPQHFGMRITSRDDLERLAREHNRVVAPHRDGTFSTYLEDPSGNEIELIYYPESEEGEQGRK